MAYNTEIEDIIEISLGGTSELIKKKMFGGLCYLYHGNMCFGIIKNFLIVRLGSEEKANKMINDKTILPFDITGRKMKEWIMVSIDELSKQEAVLKWCKMGLDFASSLPPK